MGFFQIGKQASDPPKSIWTNKEVSIFGDSNSQNPGVKTWHEFLVDEIGINTNIYARGGAGYVAKASTGTVPNIQEQITASTGDPDLLIIFAGGNDYAQSIPLGEFGDTDPATFYGALETSYSSIIEKYPLKTICVFTQTRRASEGTNSAGVTVEDQVNAVIKTAGKFSLPVLDLYNSGNVHPWNPTYLAERIPDGVHLSTSGHKVLTRKVLSFINAL